jgi:hypothetical protein
MISLESLCNLSGTSLEFLQNFSRIFLEFFELYLSENNHFPYLTPKWKRKKELRLGKPFNPPKPQSRLKIKDRREKVSECLLDPQSLESI